jgi:hypothetical protein
VDGNFGVFYGVDCISGEFGNDEHADEYMRNVVWAGDYDAADLAVRPVCEDYDMWSRLLNGLRQSRRRDLSYERLRQLQEGVLRASA